MTQPRVLTVVPIAERAAQRAREEFGAILSQDRVMTIPEVAEALDKTPSIDGVLFSVHFKMTAEAITALPSRIKIIATCSVGFDHIDLAAAAARGLIVTNTPAVLTDATAD